MSSSHYRKQLRTGRDQNEPRRKRSRSREARYNDQQDRAQHSSDNDNNDRHQQDEDILEKEAKISVDSLRGDPSWKSDCEETKMLCIEKLEDPTAQIPLIQRTLTDLSIEICTSMFDQIDLRSGNAYIKYPSTESASKTLHGLHGCITLHKQYKIDFYPSRKIEYNLVQDWYCDRCDYKNFARRNKCHRCQNPRNANCKIVYNSAAVMRSVPAHKLFFRDKDKPEKDENCSLMIRGPVVTQLDQETILMAFQMIAEVKDIRMIKNRMTGLYKDFAFVEFNSPQEATLAFRASNQPEFTIRGQPVAVMFSKSRKEEKEKDQLGLRQGKSEDAPPQEFPHYNSYQNSGNQYQHQQHKRHREPQADYINPSLTQREKQIREQKEKPLITMDQLKQRKEAEQKRLAQITQPKELTAEKSRRKQAELQLKKWEKSQKASLQTEVLYICPVCRRKFADESELRNHESLSEMHKYNMSLLKQN